MFSTTPTSRTLGPLVATLIAFLVVLSGVSWFFVHNQRAHLLQEAADRLSSIARLKQVQVTQWRQERIADATFLFGDNTVRELVQSVLRAPADAAPRQRLDALTSGFRERHGYADMLVMSADSAARVVYAHSSPDASPASPSALETARRLRQPVLSDLRRAPTPATGPAPISLDLVVPMFPPAATREAEGTEGSDAPRSAELLGFLVVRIDPRTFLYPELQSWPIPSASAETLLVRREADAAVVLNALRHEPESALNLRLPLARTNTLVVQAVAGGEGALKGADYRGRAVLGFAVQVADSPWRLVVKLDREEVLAPLKSYMALGAMAFIALMSAAFLGAGLIWKQAETERHKRDQEDLREREERYRTLFDLATDAIQVVDLETLGIREANQATVDLYGYPREELLRLRAPDLADDPRETEAMIRDGTGLVEVPLRHHRRKDGTVFPVEISARFFRFGGRRLLLMSHRNLTERKRAESDLRRLATAIEQAAEDIIITDPSGVIQYVNPAFERVTGYRREQAIGRTPRLLRSGRHDAEFYRRLWGTLRSGKVWAGRLLNRCQDGRIVEEEGTISPICGPGGELLGFVSVKRDVTHQANLERQLQQSQKMDALGQLAGGVAHDLNNLLQVIIGNAQMAAQETVNGESSLESLAEVEKAGHRAVDLVRQLLTFGRKDQLRPRHVNLNDLVAGSMKMIRRLIGEHIECQVVPGQNLPWVWVDASQVEQALVNLCVNARDAMPQGGRLQIKLTNLTVSADDCALHPHARPGEYVLLSVEDTGIGMSPEVREHAFEPFFTTKEVGRGTGLGLSTVYGILQQHQGIVTLTSEPGHGTTVRLCFPAAEAAEVKDNEPGSTPPASGRGETILVAEDEEMVLNLVTRILTGAGYQVVGAKDGEEAVEWVRRDGRAIQLALLDLVMPKKSGVDAAREIRSLHPGLPVIYASGYSRDYLRATSPAEGELNLIQKPYRPEELLARIREALAGAAASGGLSTPGESDSKPLADIKADRRTGPGRS